MDNPHLPGKATQKATDSLRRQGDLGDKDERLPAAPDHFFRGAQLCGPQVFCCAKAAHLLLETCPGAIPAGAEWEFADADLLASWMSRRGPTVYYFFFCDPRDHKVVRFAGVSGPQLRDVLFKRRPLDEHLATADRICREEE